MPLTETYVRGAVAIGDRASNVHPDEWRRRIYAQMPVGDAPFTGLMMAMGVQSTPSVTFHWAEDPFPAMKGDVTDVYTNALLTTAYVSGGVDGTTLYLKMTAADAKMIVAGNVLLITDDASASATYGAWRRVYVRAVEIVGTANSYITCELMETDTSNALASATLSWRVIGSAEPEGGKLPDPLFDEAQQFSNQCQDFKGAYMLTGREIAELSRFTPDKEDRAKARALMRCRIRMERGFLFGVPPATTKYGANGKPITFTRGITSAIETYESANVFDYKSDTDYAGLSWTSGGYNWLRKIMEQTSRYSNQKPKVFCGSLVLTALQELIEDVGQLQLESRDTEFGITIKTLRGFNRDLDFISHPLLTVDSESFRRMAIAVVMSDVSYRPFAGRDLTFIGPGDETSGGTEWLDGKKAGFHADAGIEWRNLAGMFIAKNFGVLNTA